MKAKLLKKLELTILFDDGRSFPCSFDPLRGRFNYPSDRLSMGHNVSEMLRLSGIDGEAVALTYIFDGDYEPRYFRLPFGETLTIEDHIKVYIPQFETRLQHVCLVLSSVAEETNLDEGSLFLHVRESAEGPGYIKGEIERDIPLKEGTSFSAELLREKAENVLIKKVEGLSCVLEIEGREFTLDPYGIYCDSKQGGSASRYDCETSEWYFSIRMNIPDVVQLAKRK